MQLELSENKLRGEELKHLIKYQNLYALKFANNLIKSYEELEPLVSKKVSIICLEKSISSNKFGSIR